MVCDSCVWSVCWNLSLEDIKMDQGEVDLRDRINDLPEAFVILMIHQCAQALQACGFEVGPYPANADRREILLSMIVALGAHIDMQM